MTATVQPTRIYCVTVTKSREWYERLRAADPEAHQQQRIVYREAFATLEARDDEPSARRAVRDLIYKAWRDGPPAVGDGEHFDDWRAQAAEFTGSCTIGPLPNGDVIEVEATTWRRVCEEADEGWRIRHCTGNWPPAHRYEHRRAALAAWNAEYGVNCGGVEGAR